MKERAHSGRELSNMPFLLKYYEYFRRTSCLQLRKILMLKAHASSYDKDQIVTFATMLPLLQEATTIL